MYDIDALYRQKVRIESDIRDLDSTYGQARSSLEGDLAQTQKLIEECQEILNVHKAAEDEKVGRD